MDINNNKPAITKYIINFLRGNICFIINLKEDPRETPSHTPILFQTERIKTTRQHVPSWAKGLIRYFGIFHDRVLG